jgi:hypothetical protein
VKTLVDSVEVYVHGRSALTLAMDRKQKYNLSVQNADAGFTKWCSEKDIPLFKLHHVITWEDWDNGIGVYIFLDKQSDVRKLKNNQIEEIKSKYMDLLKEHDYPFDKFPNVIFEIDSDENVRKNYSGNYFFRLR